MASDGDPVATDSYDELAEEYAKTVDERPYNADLDFPAVTGIMPDVKAKRVLDAGCGSGRYSEWLLDHDAEVTAIDASEEMVAHAKERVGNQAKVRQADLGEHLPFASEDEFDVVLSALVLHYVKDWRQMFEEFARVLKPDGIFICSIQHPIDDFNRLDIENYFDIERVSDTWSSFEKSIEVSFYWRPFSEIINPIIESGFRIDKITEPQPMKAFKEKQPNRYEKVMKQPTFMCIRAFR